MFLNQQDLSIIAGHQPQDQPQHSLVQAAVAIVLRDGANGTEFLMMQRAHHENDPWSGQMSFPGGKIDPEDESALAAAIRETEEEVGLALGQRDYVGRLDDLYGLKVNNRYSVHVACFVFKPEREFDLQGNHEVADLVWIPMSYMDDVQNNHDFHHPQDSSLKMPAVMINSAKDQILWGLSLRMLDFLFTLLGREMKVLSETGGEALEAIEQRSMQVENVNELSEQIGEISARKAAQRDS